MWNQNTVYLGCNDQNRCSSHHACQHLLFPIDHLLQLCPLQGCHYIARQGIPWMSSIHLCSPIHHLTRSVLDDSLVPAVMTLIHMIGNDQEYELALTVWLILVYIRDFMVRLSSVLFHLYMSSCHFRLWNTLCLVLKIAFWYLLESLNIKIKEFWIEAVMSVIPALTSCPTNYV